MVGLPVIQHIDLEKIITSGIEYGALKGAIMNNKGMLFSRNIQNNYNSYYNCVNSTKNIALKSESGERSYAEEFIKTFISLLQIS